MSAEEKLRLVESLLAEAEAGECARRGLEWLGLHAGARWGLCVVNDTMRTRLVGVAAWGLERLDPAAFVADTDQRGHPLVTALARKTPSIVRLDRSSDSEDGAGRLPREPFLALPLHGGYSDASAIGLLLVGPVERLLATETRWLATVLGPRLTRLVTYRSSVEAQRALERDRTLLQVLIDAVSDPILLTDANGRMVIANSSAVKLFTSKEGESEGRQRAVALNNLLFSAALSGTAVPSGSPLRRELPLVDPTDGSDLLFELLSAVVNDPKEGSGIVSILRNVTDLRAATEQIEENYRKLREAEAGVRAERDRLDLVIDSVADPILVTDPAGAIFLTNEPAERLFTVPADSPEEATARVRANDAHFTSFVSNLLFSDALRYRGEIALTDPATTVALPFEGVAGKVLSDHGELVGVVTILHDRTEALERERLYEQLKAASSELEAKIAQATAELVRQNELLRRQHIQLEQASALKSQFLANMSHEFRTPLNAILGYTSMLIAGVSGDLNTQQKRNLNRVDSNGKHLLALINDILDISRIEAGQMPVHAGEFPLPGLVAEVMAEMEPIIARSQLKVTTELDPEAAVLESDRQKVKQIVLNLLGNALKFTSEGSVTVSTRYVGECDEIAIAVKDTGIGIAPEDQTRVFDDFRQADNSPTREYGGAGLGLSICRRLATVLNGKITLQSQLGVGSTFTLTLPRKRGL